MSDNNVLHEPQMLSDAKNAIGYMLVLAFVSCGVIFILAGMVAPFFLPKLFRISEEISREEVKKDPTKNYEKTLRSYKTFFVVIDLIWMVIAWTIFVVAMVTS